MMIEKLNKIENALRMSLADITSGYRAVKMSNSNVFGKYIHLEDDIWDLENWYITLPVKESTDVPTLVDCFKSLREQYELDKAYASTYDNDFKDYTCHQLCDWMWLEGEDRKIIRRVPTLNGFKYQATLVKYARILRDLEVNDD